jgi:nucleotide sugar dehydrogenase
MTNQKIGFIGQGWIGKNYADDFEKRGFEVIRYSLEEPYKKNIDEIKTCDIVFIAVPTPTEPDGFKDGAVRDAIKGVGFGKIAVIKSTILPGTTEKIQMENPKIYVVHSPEFLKEKTAAHDASNPERNIIGIPKDTEEYKEVAKKVLSVLPKAPFESICQAKEAELIKYAGNSFLYLKVLYANLLFDLSEKLGCDWDVVKQAFGADKRIGYSHIDPLAGGRGAGGHCFIKDFAAFVSFYEKNVNDVTGSSFLRKAEQKNVELLLSSNKNIDLAEKIYENKLKEWITKK